MNWYEIENVDEVATPALLVYPDRIAENIRRMIAIAGDVSRLRPHVKTHKMPQVVRMQQEAGIDKFKCATIAEAEMVAGCDCRDVMLAYQPVGPHVERFVRLCARFPQARFSCLADNEATLRKLSAAAVAGDQSFDVLLDIDDGLHRTGVAPVAAARLYRLVDELPGLRPGGFHVYDGHAKNSDREARAKVVESSFAAVDGLRSELEAAGLPVPEVVAGGTPTFPCHAQHANRICSPGTCLLWDFGYGTAFPDLDFLHAATLLTRVVSKPAADVLCFDLGYKAIAGDQPNPRVQLFGLDDADTRVHNEEHLAITTAHAGQFEVGDAVHGIPRHICPTCALHRQVVVVRDGRAADHWDVVARDRALSI